MFVIRNKVSGKLVTDRNRVPLTFNTVDSAYNWLDSKITGLVGDFVAVDVCGIGFSQTEREQLLKLNIQKEGVK